MHYILKDLSIDSERRIIRRKGTMLKLPDLSFDVLIKLIEAAPESVSAAEFSSAVWRAEHVSDETIAQRITLLRKSLGDNPKSPIYIRTVRGAGYAILGSVVRQRNQPSLIISFLNCRRKIMTLTGVAAIILAAILFENSEIFRTEVLGANSLAMSSDVNQKSSNTILIERAHTQLRLHQARETDRAISMLREALKQDPKNFRGRLILSFALTTKATKFGGNADIKKEAETIARSLIHEQPKSSNSWSALAYALSSQGRTSESLPAYQYAYQLNPQNANALSSAAHLLLLRGELHQALLLESRAKQAGGTSRYAEIQIAQVLELIGHPKASKWYEKALFLNPNQIVILCEIAKSHLRHGHPQAALKILNQAEGDDQSAPQILQLKGRATQALGNFKEASRLFIAAGDYAVFNLAALDAISGDTAKAKILLSPAHITDLKTDVSAEFRIQLAEITAALGQKDKALQFLSQAINLGWRDIPWLEQSPYIGPLMSSKKGRQLKKQIEQKLGAQRRLIKGSTKLTSIING